MTLAHPLVYRLNERSHGPARRGSSCFEGAKATHLANVLSNGSRLVGQRLLQPGRGRHSGGHAALLDPFGDLSCTRLGHPAILELAHLRGQFLARGQRVSERGLAIDKLRYLIIETRRMLHQ